MRTGVYGGSFNPVHNGHLALARAFAEAFALDRLLVIPANVPPHKPGVALVSGEHRLRMCELAFAELAQAKVCDLELRRREKSYTVETLRELKARHPEEELILLMGSDMFLTLHHWYRYTELLSLASICVGARAPQLTEALRAQRQRLEAQGARCALLCFEPLEISSTDIRARLFGGRTVTGLVPRAVELYLIEQGLYRKTAEEGIDEAGQGAL